MLIKKSAGIPNVLPYLVFNNIDQNYEKLTSFMQSWTELGSSRDFVFSVTVVYVLCVVLVRSIVYV